MLPGQVFIVVALGLLQKLQMLLRLPCLCRICDNHLQTFGFEIYAGLSLLACFAAEFRMLFHRAALRRKGIRSGFQQDIDQRPQASQCLSGGIQRSFIQKLRPRHKLLIWINFQDIVRDARNRQSKKMIRVILLPRIQWKAKRSFDLVAIAQKVIFV